MYKKYKMDGFRYLFDNGSMQELESSLPPITPVAWPTIYTGLSPTEHGAHDFFTLTDTYSKQLIYYDAETKPPFWDILSDAGIRSLIINPPAVIKPSRKKNVDMITGFPLPQSYSSKELEEAARSSGFGGEPEIEDTLRNGSISLSDAAYKYSESIKKRAELSSRIISNNEYGLVFTCFTETDRMQHYALSMPEWEDYIVPLYKPISDFIEWLVAYNKELGGEFALAVVSDHGAQPTPSTFLVNSWLLSKGYIKLKDGAAPALTQNTSAAFSFGGASKYEERLLCAASGINTARQLETELNATKAFASLSNNPVGSIWINDSRFSSPAVKGSAEKEAVRKEIAKGLRAIRDGSGKKIVRRIHNTGEYYRNANFLAPDLMFEMAEGYTVDVNVCAEKHISRSEPSRSGDHTRYGIIGTYPKRLMKVQKPAVHDVIKMVIDFFMQQ